MRQRSSGSRFPAFIVPAVLILAGLVSSHVQAVTWPHFGYDDQYTSYCPAANRINTGNVKQLRQKWGLSCNDGWFFVVFGSPAYYKGTVYTSGAGESLNAINAQTGSVDWQFGQGNYGWAPQPAVSQDGVIFYLEGANPTTLTAVNRSGQQLWKAPISFEFGFREATYAVPTIDEGKKIVYVVESPFMGEGRLFALSKASGKVLWYKSYEKDKIGFRAPYVLLKGNWIFVNGQTSDTWYDSEHMVRINAVTKKVEITYERPTDDWISNVVRYTLCKDILLVEYADRDTLVAKQRSVLVAYKINSPKAIWRQELGGAPFTGAFACNTKLQRVYVPTNPYLYALDVKTGKQIWKFMGFNAVCSPSVANGVVYFVSDTNMYALDESNGKKLFSYDLGYEADESVQVAIGDDAVYVSGSGGTCDFVALGLP